MISKPTLPPRRGYIEVEVDGRRTYRNIETGELIDNEVPVVPDAERIKQLESENELLKAQVNALSEQNDFQEELIVELANVVYA